jgi:hypothetical protein
MRQGNVWHCFDFGHLQNSQIGLPLPKSIKRIMVRAEVFWHHPLASNGLIEHSAECPAVDHSGLDTEPNDPSCVLIHDDQDPVGPQHGRFAPEQIDTPEAVLQVSNEGQPGGTCGVLSRSIVTCENPSHNVLIDLDVES